MKKLILLFLAFFSVLNLSAQQTVTTKSGKEVIVNKDASSTEKGIVKLTGDLGGTADAPTVPALTSKIDGTGTENFIPKFTGTKTLGNSLFYDTGTYIGLGTTTPVSKFEIVDASETFTGNGTLRISNNSAPTVNKFAGLVFKSNNVASTGGSWKIGSNQETTTSYEQNFHFLNSYNGSTYASKMTLTPGGFVGIGTTTPATKLEIKQGTEGNSGLRFTNLTSSSTASTSSNKVLALNSTGDVILTNVPGTQNIVDFSTATPTASGVVFTPNTPADESVVYQSAVDNSMWTYNGSTYVTYNAPASTAWYTAGTTNDAGNSKTSNIYRTGSVGIGVASPTVPLDVQSALSSTYVTTAKFLAPNNTGTGNSTLLNFGVSATTGNSADWRYFYQSNAASTNRVDFGMSGYGSPMMSYLNNGNIGIGTTSPLTKLHIQGISAAAGANASAQMLRLSRPSVSGVKWDNIAQFNLGTYFDDAVGANNVDAKSRLDVALTNSNNNTFFTTVMTWLANGKVGINNTAPSAPLVVQGANATGALKLISGSPTATGDNWWLGFGHGTTSTDANDRARVGVDIAGGGAGRLFFTTGIGGSQTRAMFIDEAQKVGIGTSTPTAQLEVATTSGSSAIFRRGNTSGGASNIYLQRTQNADPNINTAGSYSTDVIGKVLFSMANGTSYPTNGNASIESYYTGVQTTSNAGGGLTFKTTPSGTITPTERMRIDHNGNVGIGDFSATAPSSKLEVNGSATNSVAYNNGGANAIAFSLSNLAYTSLSAGSFTLTGMKDGGTYTLAVQGTSSGTASFSGANPSGTAFTFKSVNNGPTIAGKQTLYTFVVMGTTVYYYMAAGF